MTALLMQLLVDEDGQDLVEYALLAVFVGLAGLAVWAAIQDAFVLHYAALDDAEQSLWQPPNP